MLSDLNHKYKNQIITGSFWVLISRVLGQLVSLGRIAILSRILAPNDFGSFAIALLCLSLLEVFSQPGLNHALVQTKKDTISFLHSVWTLNAFRGLLLSICLYFIAPTLATYFGAPESVLVIKTVGACAAIRGLTSLGLIYFQKEINFSKQFTYNMAGVTADAISTITLAFILNNALALSIGILVGDIVKVLISYILHPYRPRIEFDLSKIKELRKFGWWIYLSTILVFLVISGDSFVVGKMLGAASLGIYQLAYRIGNLATTEVANIVAQVAFPLYSKLQGSMHDVRKTFLRSISIVLNISMPIVFLTALLNEQLVDIFLGKKWFEAGPPMAILAIAGLFRAIAATTTPLFRGIGTPEIETKAHLIRFIVLLIFFYPATAFWGLKGMAYVVLASSVIWVISVHYAALKLLNIHLISIIRAILPCTIATFFATTLLSLVGSNHPKTIIEISSQIFISTTIYLVVLASYTQLSRKGLIRL